MERHELGRFLRSRREHLTCADVGLPVTGRRRTPGLRREELAMLAGISTTWLTYLEQGRDVRASDQVLASLTRALRLSPAERDHVYALAGFPGPVAPAEPLAPHVDDVAGALGPHPAYVTAADYELLAFNAAAEELFRGLARMGNLARWLFTDPAARDLLPDWTEIAQDVLARLRAAQGRHPGEERFTRLVADLHDASPEVRSWWPRQDVRATRSGTKRVRHPRRGVLTLSYVSFQVADHPDQTLVVYLDPGAGDRP
ncbi:helix-turn-helix transcriptional regulator [Cryptosporangium japonicum]|uniref:Helix-turn-helix transcriptional regulator n=1 Tax=Cryptosporangium japonicum TaxID=80872 RepID=A0ABN0U7K7_9ACTN